LSYLSKKHYDFISNGLKQSSIGRFPLLIDSPKENQTDEIPK